MPVKKSSHVRYVEEKCVPKALLQIIEITVLTVFAVSMWTMNPVTELLIVVLLWNLFLSGSEITVNGQSFTDVKSVGY